MSFIHCYHYLKITSNPLLTSRDSEAFIKLEKLLKTEVRIDSSKFNTNDVERFLEAVKNNSPLLQFLATNDEFYSLLFERFDYFKDYGTPDLEKYDFFALKQEIEVNLMQELNQFVITRLEPLDFHALKVLLKYSELLPMSVLDLLTYRLEFKLDGYMSDMIAKGKLKNDGEFRKVGELITLFPAEILVKKEAKVQHLIAKEMGELVRHIDKPGIVFFFETMFKGLHYMFYVPTDPYELKIRNRVMGDFKFMAGLLGIIVLILAVGFMFFKKDDTVKESDFEKKGFYESFAKPSQNDVLLVGNYSDTLKTGFDFVSGSYVVAKSKETVTIQNKTDYDLIVFSDFEIVKTYAELDKNSTFKGRYFYIKSQDSFTMDSGLYPMHFYFGQSLFSTKTQQQIPPNLPRFFHAHANTLRLVVKPFELKNATITFEGDSKSIRLLSDKGVFADGILVRNLEL